MTAHELLQNERQRILEFLDERGAKDVRIFGSLARGDADAESDIDLIVELPAGASAGSELMTVLGLSEELSHLLGANVEVVTPRVLRDEVRQSALAEAIPL